MEDTNSVLQLCQVLSILEARHQGWIELSLSFLLCDCSEELVFLLVAVPELVHVIYSNWSIDGQKKPRRWDLIMQLGTEKETRGIGGGEVLGGYFLYFSKKVRFWVKVQVTLWKLKQEGMSWRQLFFFWGKNRHGLQDYLKRLIYSISSKVDVIFTPMSICPISVSSSPLGIYPLYVNKIR